MITCIFIDKYLGGGWPAVALTLIFGLEVWWCVLFSGLFVKTFHWAIWVWWFRRVFVVGKQTEIWSGRWDGPEGNNRTSE